jgi:hypothetical protein
MTHAQLRKEYLEIRSAVLWTAYGKASDFDAAVRKLLPENPTPEQWVEKAKVVQVHCGRCGGTGRFITGSLNGKLTGPGGICFRCEGKGKQNLADAKRNAYYDEHQPIYL